VERLCKGLAYAHKKGIVHRDLKPGNVLFDNNGEAFISDFGVAKLADAAQNMTGSGIVGTPAYMSPEQAQSGHVDARADIYAMGVILYEMLTGKQPYKADTPMGVVVKHITDPVPEILRDNPELPPELDEIIKKCMDKNPDNRYATLTDLAMALNKSAFGDAGATRLNDSQLTRPMAPSALPVAVRGANKKFVWIGAGAGALILAVAAFLLLRGNPAAGPVEASPTVAPTAAATVIQSTVTPVASPFGGADKFAFVSNKDIWLMNPDGSEAAPLTGDGSEKRNLQWLPDGKTLVYISETCVYTIDVTVGQPQRLTCFQEVKRGFDAFRVSPDGKRVAISLDLQLMIVPFDMDALAKAVTRGDLTKMDGACVDNRVSVKDVRWSRDATKLAAVYVDNSTAADQIRVLDISHCETAAPMVQGSFPGKDFTIKGFKDNPVFSSFDWDGGQTFVFTDSIRNGGFGNLYLYDIKTQQGKMFNPIEEACCYRDARFSPDGKYLLFLFQDNRAADQAAIQLFYAPFNPDGTLQIGEPISLALGMFPGQREAPQPAIRPIQ
jgi:dipeptidyl aminopeptidase/acylaminoacyl peptidase